MLTSRSRALLSDFRVYLAAAFALRLIGITNPPLEAGHNWRQSLTNMMARNFYERGPDLLYPTIDMAGGGSPVIASEFPLFQYLIYLAAVAFDYSHWAGRLINLAVSTLGVYAFYRLLRDLLGEPAAFNAGLFLLLSIWFAFSRKIMPDTFSVSLVLMGLYAASRYLRGGGGLALGAFFALSTLGMLGKIPALSLFSGLGVVAFLPAVTTPRKVALFAAGTVGFAIVCAWYFYWVPHLLAEGHFKLYFPKGLREGIAEIVPLWPQLLKRFYADALKSYLAFGVFVYGLVVLARAGRPFLLAGFGLVSVVFAVFIVKTGSVFPLHNYYVIAYVPVMAAVAGYGLARVPRRWQTLALALVAVESIANQQHDFFIRGAEEYRLGLEAITERYVPRDSLIVINGGQNPQDIYFAHRRGWTVDHERPLDATYLDALRQNGAAFLIVDRHRLGAPVPRYRTLYEDEDYRVYDLRR